MEQHVEINSDENVYFPNSLGQPGMQPERDSSRKDQGLVMLMVFRNLAKREPSQTPGSGRASFLCGVGKLGINQLQQVTDGF